MTTIKTIDDLSVATDCIRRKLLSPAWPDEATHLTAKSDFPENNHLDKTTLSAWCDR